ncbi:hypothetical protein [Paenibacillus sp. BK720]|uniref:hypothetical protein n=1 Tax=Paenibacillus sp. BK720 TaxID=2587092 RepID=UPI0014205879|nr:hypothetical protein [Paenibacillus sp. BK720]NIK72476.1 hypothetical protein [Paenibacillus sp. BK720]
MTNLFILSYVILWGVVFLLVYTLISVMKKQVVKEVAGSDIGLDIGTKFPIEKALTIDNKDMTIFQAKSEASIVLLASVWCEMCKNVLPLFLSVAKQNPQYQFSVMMLGSVEDIRQCVLDFGISLPVKQADKFEDLQTSLIPFVYALDGDGHVLAKGIINTEEHLQVLLTIAKKTKRKYVA